MFQTFPDNFFEWLQGSEAAHAEEEVDSECVREGRVPRVLRDTGRQLERVERLKLASHWLPSLGHRPAILTLGFFICNMGRIR